jgi:hypothetical protein
MRKRWVYIAGPISKGVMIENIAMALREANYLLLAGFGVFIPQLSVFHAMLNGPQGEGWSAAGTSTKAYANWLDLDFDFIRYHAAALLRLPGESSGADQEVMIAAQANVPVFTSAMDVVLYFRHEDRSVASDERQLEFPKGFQANEQLADG